MFERWKRYWKRDADLELEIRGHLETEIDERVEAGESATEARRAAQRAFGSGLLAAEEARAAWGWPAVEAVGQDLLHGLRLLRRSPAFALFTVVSLALGIGGTTAIFTLFDAIVLRHLPVKEPDRLVTLSFGVEPGKSNSFLPYPQFVRMREGNHTMDGLFAIAGPRRIAVTVNGQSSLASGLFSTGDYYTTLGLQPALGRLLASYDDRPGNGVAVISYSYWQTRFGGSEAVIGSGILINQVPFTIVGVEPHGFFGTQVGSTNDVTIPMRARDMLYTGEPLWNKANSTWIQVMGRLKPDVSRLQAEQDLGPLFMQVSLDAAGAVPGEHRAEAERRAREDKLMVKMGAGGTTSGLRLDYERWLRLLLALLAAVMLLAGLNVATLQLARSGAREREIATRLALGAGRWRIVRQLLTESALLAGIGGTLGLALAWFGSTALLHVAMPAAERLPLNLTPDARIVGFTIAAEVFVCLLFGLLPALRSTGVRRVPSSGREVGRRHRRLLDRTLVTVQVAVSLVLVVFAGLFLRSLTNLWTQATGYDRGNILMFSVDAGLAGKKGDDARNMYLRLIEELKNLPGALSVTASSVRPVDDNAYFVDIVTRIGTREFPGLQAIRIAYNDLAPGYFSTMGVPLLAGRDFDPHDDANSPKVAIISETMAHRRFPGENPVGQIITMSDAVAREIIGVARDVRYGNVKDAPRDVVYNPMFQAAGKEFRLAPNFEVRYAGTEEQMRRLVHSMAARVTPELALFRMKTLEVQTQESLARERLLASLTAYFGAFALLLACIGLYGLMSYAVTQRTPEIGLRMALGARPGGVRWLVLRESAVTVVAGLTLGFGGAVAAVRVVRTQLFGVEPADPLTFAVGTMLLFTLAVAAAYLPASRASKINPVTALRNE